jgi:beta-glucosidase
VHLEVGESKEVSFEINPETLSKWDIDMNYVVEEGIYKIFVGASSEEIKLKGEIKIEQKEP